MIDTERWEKGLEIIREIEGEAGMMAVEGMKGLHPNLAKYMVEFVFGDVYALTALDKKMRSMSAIAALTALGSAPQVLKNHIQQAVKEGCTQSEVMEMLLFLAVGTMMMAQQAFQEMSS